MRRVLFLTSTVYPSGIEFVGTYEQRHQEYVNAIQFYLDETDCYILIVDNSGYDFSQDFCEISRLECLSYKEANHSAQGKGYGELSLMQFGFEHSRFLQDVDQIVKITGRHIVKNINRLVSSCTMKQAVYADVDIQLTFAMTYFFVAPKTFYDDFLFPNRYKLNDSKGFYFEHLMAQSLKKWLADAQEFHEFKYPIHIIGHQGASSKSYRSPGMIRYLKIMIKYLIREQMNRRGVNFSLTNDR